jgi:hypothetical protein
MFLDLPDPDPLVRDEDPGSRSFPFLIKVERQESSKTENNVPAGKL